MHTWNLRASIKASAKDGDQVIILEKELSQTIVGQHWERILSDWN